MKTNWQTKKLGEVLNVLTNGVNCKQDKDGQGCRITRIETIAQAQIDFNRVGYCKLNEFEKIKYKLKKGDILFSHINSVIHVGKTAIFNSEEELYHGINLLLMRPKNFLLPDYLQYFLKSLFWVKYWNKVCKQSVNQASVNQQDIKKIDILFPESLSEQKRIVKILDEAFGKIEKAKENADKNLQNSKELFESYLQNVFAPPSLKLRTGKESAGKDWEEKRFDELCVLQRGFDLPTRLRNEGKFPLVSSNGITDRIDLWKVKAPGVVTGRSGTIGNVHYIEEDFWPLNTALYIKDFHGNCERFIFYFLKQFNLGKFSSGAGVPTLNRNNVHGEMVWFPKSITEQKTIVKKLDALSEQTKKLEGIYRQKLADLEELKKSVLNKAFKGEL